MSWVLGLEVGSLYGICNVGTGGVESKVKIFHQKQLEHFLR